MEKYWKFSEKLSQEIFRKIWNFSAPHHYPRFCCWSWQYTLSNAKAPTSALSTLLRVFNDLWQSGDFPKSWSNATIIPIAKPGKDPTSPNNYRPIALTSCVCKTFERMVNERLVWYLESNNILTEYQSGFCKRRSATDQLVKLESYIREAFVCQEHVGMSPHSVHWNLLSMRFLLSPTACRCPVLCCTLGIVGRLLGGIKLGKCLSVKRVGNADPLGLPPLLVALGSAPVFWMICSIIVMRNSRPVSLASGWAFIHRIWAFKRLISMRWKATFLYHLIDFRRNK